jgi:predicted AAA+ superfamily ATPase
MTKLYNDFKSQGFKISKDTVFNYFAYLEDAYALFLTPIYRNSVREEQRNPKKVYAVDAGFKKLYDYAISQDVSKLYENSVFLALRRKTKEIYYFKERQEVDFYAKIEGRPLLINVSVEIGDAQTKEREIGGLLEAMAYFKMDESYLITQDKKGEEVIEGKRIMILPLYEWLLKIEEIDDLV